MNFKKILEPRSMAVIGVSLTNPFNPANVIYNKNNLRYNVDAYCVNPKGGTLYGETVYRSVKDIPAELDLAVLSVKAEYVPGTLKDCIKAGVAGAIIISGGFSESGRDDLQNEVTGISKANDFPVIGPNCLGIFSPPHIDTFFLPHERLISLKTGPVAIISQSGGILIDQMIKLSQEGIGLSRAVSIGNKAAIDEVDMLKFFITDKNTEVIGIYVEGFYPERGREFINLVNKSKKPVVVLKSGKTPGGSRAVSSHTASLAGDYLAFSEILKGSNALEAKDEQEFVSFCEALSCYKKLESNNICIITGSGGHGAIAADGCFNSNINIVNIPDKDRAAVKRNLSKSIQEIASLANPIDLTGSAKDNDFYTVTRFFIEKDYVDCILLLILPYIPGVTGDIGARIAQLTKEFNKPIITYLPHIDKFGIFIDGFESNGVPVAHSVEGAVLMAKSIMGE